MSHFRGDTPSHTLPLPWASFPPLKILDYATVKAKAEATLCKAKA